MRALKFLSIFVAGISLANTSNAEPTSQEACLYFANKHVFPELELQYSYETYKNFQIPSPVKSEDSLNRYAAFLWPQVLFEAYLRSSDTKPSVMGKIHLVCLVDYVDRRVLSIEAVLPDLSDDTYELENGDKISIEQVKPMRREVGGMVHGGRY